MSHDAAPLPQTELRNPELQDVIDAVLLSTTARLASRSSSALVDGELDPVYRAHVAGILNEAWTRLAGLRDYDYLQDAAALDLGLMQATAAVLLEEGLHPAEPVISANALFEAALPVFIDRLPVAPVAVALVLHSSVFGRFVPGALAYAERLRVQLGEVQRTTELRMSRYLRAVIEPELSAARAALDEESDAEAAASAARRHLERARAHTEELSWELGQPAPEAFPAALRRAAAHAHPLWPPLVVTEIGTAAELTDAVQQELHAIAVEAVRNARRHAAASRVDVIVHWRPASVVLTVADDGHGASLPLEEFAEQTFGIAEMRRRAALARGRIRFETAETGTTITVTCPTVVGAGR